MRRLVGILIAALAAALLLVVAAPTASAAEPTGDPAADDYSPWVWINAWSAPGAQDTARAGDTTEGLQHSGMVIAAVTDQLNALTAADKAQLDTSWHAGGLLQGTYQRAQRWSTAAFQAVASDQPVATWSPADSDSVAGQLGGTSYAALTPGLKSVVQRIATIVTGDTKPPMPDEAWSTWMSPATKAAFDARPDTRFNWSGVSQTPPGVQGDPGSQVTMECDAGVFNWLCHATQAAAGAVVATIDFVQNPLGYLAAAVQGAAVWVMGQLALFANQSTQPDLTASWWIDTYKKGFAIATVLFGFALLVEILQVARRKASADDLIETVSIWVPAWFAGVLFGPALAQFVINGSGLLADGIIHSLTGFSGGDAFKAISDAAGNTGIGAGAVGAAQAFMSLLLGLGVLIASLLVYVSLCVQAVIIYLATAVFAIGWVWIVTQRHREDAWRIPRLVLVVSFSKGLLFFLVGLVMAIANSATAIQGDGVGRDFALVVMAIIGLLIVAFAPLMLLKHAPVMPGTSTSREGDGVTMGAAARAGRDAGVNARDVASKAGSKLGVLAASRGGKSKDTDTGTVNASKAGRSLAVATPYRRPGQGASTGAAALSAGAPAPGASQVAGRPGRPALTASASSLTAQTAGPTGSRPPGKSGSPRTFQSGSTSQQGPVPSAQRRIEQPPRRNIQTPPRSPSAAAPVLPQPATPVEEPTR